MTTKLPNRLPLWYTPVVQRRHVVVSGLATAGIVIAILVLTSKPTEPAYDRKTLTQWLRIYQIGGTEEGTPLEAAEAIRQIGTNAFCTILTWIEEDDEDWFDRMERDIRSLPGPFHGPALGPAGIKNQVRLEHMEFCATAPRLLGTIADGLIPELRRLMYHTNDFVSAKALRALANTGSKGLGTLLQALSTTPRQARRISSVRIALAIRDAHDAHDKLGDLFGDDEKVRTYITNTVRKIAPEALTNSAAK